MNLLRGWMVLAAALAAAGCSDSTGGPATRTDAELTFTRPAATAAPLSTDSVSMWAVVGQDREMHLYYLPRPGESSGQLCLRFRVRARSLFQRPDGTGFGANDSIQITLRVLDLEKQLFDFQPAGLRFNASEPADLQIRLVERDHDFNGDGVETEADTTIQTQQLSVWRREDAGRPWVKQSSASSLELDEIETDIFGFTHYVVAF